ncbi:MAG: hypothetical protein LBU55_03680 [Elusimicrobiota bacterium]|jgi:outer membrane protein assembly factor BamE (lipoprotein component of BamABCDE complex)|nr:hypothetical protein [Elusimicrobiota bacterium]
MKFCIAVFLGLVFLSGCASSVNKNIAKEERLTVAKAQRQIKIGMSSSDVIEVLGSPNMITTDDQRREMWVYDRVSTQIDSSSSASGIWLLLVGFDGEKHTSRTSQKSLTIVIKFDKENRVRDFAYRSSKF